MTVHDAGEFLMRTRMSHSRGACSPLLAAASLLAAPLRCAGCAQTAAQPQQPQVRAGESAPGSHAAARASMPPGGKATIRSTVSLVEIDVQVTDRDGKPIKGLKQEQFSVTEDGKPQKVSTFEYNDIEQIETAGSGDEAPITVPLGTVTAPEEIKAVVHDHRMIVLFFDMTSLQAGGSAALDARGREIYCASR